MSLIGMALGGNTVRVVNYLCNSNSAPPCQSIGHSLDGGVDYSSRLILKNLLSPFYEILQTSVFSVVFIS